MVCLSALYAFQRPFRQFPGVEYYTFELTPDWQEKAEFAFARLMFPPGPLNGYRGRDAEWHQGISLWTQDYPRADRHFSQAVRRLTRLHTRSTGDTAASGPVSGSRATYMHAISQQSLCRMSRPKPTTSPLRFMSGPPELPGRPARR